MKIVVNDPGVSRGRPPVPPVVLDDRGHPVPAPVQYENWRNRDRDFDVFIEVPDDCLVLRTLRSTHSAADLARTVTAVQGGTAVTVPVPCVSGDWRDLPEFPVLADAPPAGIPADAIVRIRARWPAIVRGFGPPAATVQRWITNAARGGAPVPVELGGAGCPAPDADQWVRLDITPTQASGGVKEITPVLLDFQGQEQPADIQCGRWHKNGQWSYSDLYLYVRDCLVLRTLRSTHRAGDRTRVVIVVHDGKAERMTLPAAACGTWDEVVEFPALPDARTAGLSAAAYERVDALWPVIIRGFKPPAYAVQRWLDRAAQGGAPVPAEFDGPGLVEAVRQRRREWLAALGADPKAVPVSPRQPGRPATPGEIELFLDPLQSRLFAEEIGGWEVHPVPGQRFDAFYLRPAAQKA